MFGWGEGMGAGQRMQPNAISLKIKSHFCISKQSLQFHSGLMTCKAHRSLMAGLHQNTERQNKGKKILLRKDRLSSSQVAFLNSLCFLAESLSWQWQPKFMIHQSSPSIQHILTFFGQFLNKNFHDGVKILCSCVMSEKG
jgi:hypothetical protein